MAGLSVAVTSRNRWIAESTDLSTCAACQETIYSTMYRLIVVPVVNTHSRTMAMPAYVTDVVICDSCHKHLTRTV